MEDETQQPEVQNGAHKGIIKNVGSLDLRHVRSPEEFARIEGLMNVGMILVSEDQMANIVTIPMTNVGVVVPVPVGPNVKILSGEIEVSGEVLSAHDENTVLVIAGQVMVTSPVSQLRSSLVVAGQLIAPRVSEVAIGSKIQGLFGQVVYYKGSSPRQLIGDNTVSADYLKMAVEPMTLILVGNSRFAPDITADLLKEKVHDLILVGDVYAPSDLHGVIQYLASTKVGNLIDTDKPIPKKNKDGRGE